MNLSTIQSQLVAIQLAEQYKPITDKIRNLSEDIMPMSSGPREDFIKENTIVSEIGSAYSPTFVYIILEEFFNGGIVLDENYGNLRDQYGLGNALLKEHTPMDIYLACTFDVIYNQVIARQEPLKLVYSGVFPLVYDGEADEGFGGVSYGREATFDVPNDPRKEFTIVKSDAFSYAIFNYSYANTIRSFDGIPDPTEQEGTDGFTAIKELNTLRENMPDPTFTINMSKDEIKKLLNELSKLQGVQLAKIDSSDVQNNLDKITQRRTQQIGWKDDIFKAKMPTKWSYYNPTIVRFGSEPNFFEVGVAQFRSFLSEIYNNYDYKGTAEFRIYKTDNGTFVDGSIIEQTTTTVFTADKKFITGVTQTSQPRGMFVSKMLQSGVPYKITIDPNKSRVSRLEGLEKQKERYADILKLPNFVTARQLQVPFQGKSVAMSVASMLEWEMTNGTYEDALGVIGKHLDYYTSIDETGIRKNKPSIYNQTKEGMKRVCTDKNGKFNEAMFSQIMSKYVFTVEETFFNNNPEFSDPEKLLGYFLGTGTVASALDGDADSAYRILCARLLGIDYVKGYSGLCRESAKRGFLFIAEFDDEEQPVYVNAETLFQDNFWKLHINWKLSEEVDEEGNVTYRGFLEDVKDFFGKEDAKLIIAHHQNLILKYAPRMMKFFHGGINEYERTVRAEGVGNAYQGKKKNAMRENTRIILNEGMFADRAVYLSRQNLQNIVDSHIGVEARDTLQRVVGETLDEAQFDFNRAQALYSTYAETPLITFASDKLRNNDMSAQDTINNFYTNSPIASRGPSVLFKSGITITNQDLGNKKVKRKTGIVKGSRFNQTWSPGSVFYHLRSTENQEVLKSLGYKDEDLDDLSKVIFERGKGLYLEMKSQTRIEGDELFSYAVAMGLAKSNSKALLLMEYAFNILYNGQSKMPEDECPMFLETMRHFGKLTRFVADTYTDSGKLSGFSLRPAQKGGLKYLGANGNSGILAHEVGFGKTTSTIAKISDMFIRGDAKRILVTVPNSVYASGNWQEEIEGATDNFNRKAENGLLPSYVNIVDLGNLSFDKMLGKRISPDDPRYEERSEGTGFDGWWNFSDAEQRVWKAVKSIGVDALTDVVGSKGISFSNKGSMLTPDEVNSKYTNTLEYLRRKPLFKTNIDRDKSQIVRFNDEALQTLGNAVKTIKSGDYDFWDIGADDTAMFFGKLDDYTTEEIKEENSFLKKITSQIFALDKDLQYDEEGGDVKALLKKLQEIHDKYLTEFRRRKVEDRNEYRSNPKSTVKALGGAFPPKPGKGYPKEQANYQDDGSKEYFAGWDGDVLWSFVAKSILNAIPKKGKISEKKLRTLFWPVYGTRSFFERIIVPFALDKIKQEGYETNEDWAEDLGNDLEVEFGNIMPYSVWSNSRTDDAKMLAQNQLKTALEMQMTEEIAFFLDSLSKQMPFFMGSMKSWAKKPNTVLISSHRAIPLLSVPKEFSDDSVQFLSGIFNLPSPTQRLNYRGSNEHRKKPLEILSANANEAKGPFRAGVMIDTLEELSATSEFRGLDINLLNCDAFIVDEVHNFNRGFNKVLRGTRVDQNRGRNDVVKSTPQDFGKIQANVKGNLVGGTDSWAYDFDTNYNINAKVQVFISVCMYFQGRAKLISDGQKRKISNTIFLSATPFTDDNFQMLTLFGALDSKKLFEAGIYNTFDFFRTYVNELWQKDIDYQNQYTLFAKVVGYKNTYALSQLIKSYTDFRITDKEIEANRPLKVLVGVDPIRLFADIEKTEVIENEGLSKMRSLVPFSEAQEKMNKDLEDYITLKSDSQLAYTESDVKKALAIRDKLNKKPTESVVKEQIEELKELTEIVENEDGTYDVLYDSGDPRLRIEELLEQIMEDEPDNEYALKVQEFFGRSTITLVGDADVDDDEEKEEDTGGKVDVEAMLAGSNLSRKELISQRALESATLQVTSLISPYYATIRKDKNLMNPYLPPLDGTPLENARRVIENSPKLLYTCLGIGKVLDHAINQKKQKYADTRNPIMGQVVFARNFRFTYHGKNWDIFELMQLYIIDEFKDLLMQTGKKEEELPELFAKITGSNQEITNENGEKEDAKAVFTRGFQSGRILILFGTETIREGINLQKNCPIMFILQVGFKPVTFMQLHGRIWRQKNPYKYAFLINVLTQNSIDAFVYSKLEQKIKTVEKMLGSEVYDGNETQFDVDVNGIKIKLINDPMKLAEMQWDEDSKDLSRQQSTLQSELDVMDSIATKYPEAIARYGEKIEIANKLSERMFEAQLATFASLIRKKTNQRRQKVAVDALFDKQYPAQFPDAKTKTAFDNAISKASGGTLQLPKNMLDKAGKPLYQTPTQMRSSLARQAQWQKMTVEESREEVLEMNLAEDTPPNQTLFINEGLQLTQSSTIDSFVSGCQSIRGLLTDSFFDNTGSSVSFDPSGQLVIGTMQVENNKLRDQVASEAVTNGDIASAVEKMSGSQKQIVSALVRAIYKDVMGSDKVRDFVVLFEDIKESADAKVINDYNDIIGKTVKLSADVDTTLSTEEQVEKVRELKKQELESVKSRLDDEDGELQKLSKKFEADLAKIAQEDNPTVEDRG